VRRGIWVLVDASVTDRGRVGTGTKVRTRVQLCKLAVGVSCVTVLTRVWGGLLKACATAPTIGVMISAYESGQSPEIEVRHRLRIAREYAGLEQEELSELSGISRSTISSAELGKKRPHRTTLNAWALACGVPASWIKTGQRLPTNGFVGWLQKHHGYDRDWALAATG
jgi:DNA-binding XRE family transcriptional regulator